MTTPEFDADGYPTEHTIHAVELWSYLDAAGCLDFVRAAWYYPDYQGEVLTAHEAGVLGASPGERYARFATAGWSGNEELIRALKNNRFIWLLTWRLSARGGLHIFEYPTSTFKESEPHVIRMDGPTPENDPMGRFRGTT